MMLFEIDPEYREWVEFNRKCGLCYLHDSLHQCLRSTWHEQEYAMLAAWRANDERGDGERVAEASNVVHEKA